MVTALARARRPAAGRGGQRPDPPRRRDRRRRRRQGGALPAAVRRVRAARPVPLRHARLHGRPGRRAHGDRAPLRAHVPRRAPTCRVPTGTIVLRKGYGLGAQAMAGGGFKAPLFTVAWPTSEFGAMGLEGAVRLGMRRELEAIEDPDERERAVRADGRHRLRARPRPQHGRLRRDRRRDRPRRLAALDRDAVRRAQRPLVAARPASAGRTSTPGRPARAPRARELRRRVAAAASASGIIGSGRHRARSGWTRRPSSTSIFSRAGIRRELDRNDDLPRHHPDLRMRTVRTVAELRARARAGRRERARRSGSCRRWAPSTRATSR